MHVTAQDVAIHTSCQRSVYEIATGIRTLVTYFMTCRQEQEEHVSSCQSPTLVLVVLTYIRLDSSFGTAHLDSSCVFWVVRNVCLRLCEGGLVVVVAQVVDDWYRCGVMR